jgi:GGDEF domain-containing protein
MRSGILEAAKAISESVQVMERSHKVAIAELRDEIRLLHKQIERERNTPFIDPATDVWNRSKLDTNIEDLLRQQRPFCVLLVCVRNLKLLELRHSRTVLAGALKALLQRLAAMLDERAGIGRWDEQNFAAILEMDSKQAIAVSRTAAARLSGTYSVQENGLSHTVVVQAVTGVIERDSGTDSQSIRQKLAQMSEALAGG